MQLYGRLLTRASYAYARARMNLFCRGTMHNYVRRPSRGHQVDSSGSARDRKMYQTVFRDWLSMVGGRVVVVAVNVIVLVLCLVVFGTGLWARLSEATLLDITEYPALTRTSVAVALVGLCAFLLSIVGIAGALLLKSLIGRIVLSVYAFVLVFLITTEIAAGVAAIESRNGWTKHQIANSTVDSLCRHWSNHSYSAVWARFQRKNKCCGAKSFEDYYDIFNYTEVPRSCCTSAAVKSGHCNEDFVYVPPSNASGIHTHPCVDEIIDKLWYKMLVLAVVTIVISVVQSTGTIASTIVIFIASRDREKTYSYRKLKHRSRSSGSHST